MFVAVAKVECYIESRRNRMKQVITLLSIVFLIGGCASGNGYMRGVDNLGESISIKFNQGFASDQYSAEYRGESFSGRAVMIGKEVSFGTAFVGDDIASGISSTTTGEVKAVLIGNKGTSLKCLMNYADSLGLINFGGVGSCVHSSGTQLEVVW